MNELAFQARLVKGAKSLGGYAQKMSNRHIAGVPDLFVKLKSYEGVFIECKIQKNWKGPYSRLDLTKLQRQTLYRMHSAAQPCGWVMLYQEKGPRDKYAAAGADPYAEFAENNKNCTMIGIDHQYFHVSDIVKQILYWSEKVETTS